MAQQQNRNDNAVNDARRTATMASRNVEDIPQLPMVKVDHEQVDNEAQCTTCLETFNLNEKVAKLKCQHIFHRACIQPWLQRNNTCPVCRAKVELRRDMGVKNTERRDMRVVNIEHRDMRVVHMENRHRDSEPGVADIYDAFNELLHHRIEIVPGYNRMIDHFASLAQQAVENGNEGIRHNANVEMDGRVIDNLASLFTGAWF